MLPPIARNRSSVDLSRNYDTPLERIASMKTQRPQLQYTQPPPAGDMELAASFKLPYIQQGASRQEVAEVNAKVRELEINLMDLKASVDRRFA